jgi:hypothetical protein
MFLSPLAHPFEPRSTFCGEEDLDFHAVIYNDGVPSLAPFGREGESEIIRGISDEAIDEYFLGTATAQEVAEMEAVEFYVMMLAHLDLLEEQEEKSRKNYAYGLTKRWMVRRELQGKPKPARHTLDLAAKTHRKQVDELMLVPFHRRHRDLVQSGYESRHSHRGGSNKRSNVKNNHKKVARPILQPRK